MVMVVEILRKNVDDDAKKWLKTTMMIVKKKVLETEMMMANQGTSIRKLKTNIYFTSFPCVFFHRSHLLNPGRQYSSTYASEYS